MSFIKSYAKFLVTNPVKFLVFLLFMTFLGTLTFSSLVTENPDNSDILPDSIDEVKAMNMLGDNLGGGENTAFMVVLELDPKLGSDIFDIRDPRVVRYSYLIEEQIKIIDDITGTSGIGSKLYTLNENSHVNALYLSKSLIDKNSNDFNRLINDKQSLTIIRVNANSGFDVAVLENEVQKIIDNTKIPRGISVKLAGETIAAKLAEDLVGPDSAKTTNISLGLIVLILFITFRSALYGALPLFTIMFGVAWTFTFIALRGIVQSSYTAGAMSMIIGIGIDFGIQTIMRYKSELEKSNPVLAMQHTLESVLKPMLITTFAAFIGFYAMKAGDLTILQDLGRIMAFGVVFCFLAAATVVPCVAVIYEVHVRNFFSNK